MGRKIKSTDQRNFSFSDITAQNCAYEVSIDDQRYSFNQNVQQSSFEMQSIEWDDKIEIKDQQMLVRVHTGNQSQILEFDKEEEFGSG